MIPPEGSEECNTLKNCFDTILKDVIKEAEIKNLSWQKTFVRLFTSIWESFTYLKLLEMLEIGNKFQLMGTAYHSLFDARIASRVKEIGEEIDIPEEIKQMMIMESSNLSSSMFDNDGIFMLEHLEKFSTIEYLDNFETRVNQEIRQEIGKWIVRASIVVSKELKKKLISAITESHKKLAERNLKEFLDFLDEENKKTMKEAFGW